MIEPRSSGARRQREINVMGDLGRQLVKCESGDETEDRARCFDGGHDKIGIRDGRRIGELIHASTRALHHAGMQHCGQRPRMNSSRPSLPGSEGATSPLEHLACLFD